MKKSALIAMGAVLMTGASAFAGTPTYTSSGNNVLIPDNSTVGATLDLVITDDAIIKDLNVGLIITHTWQGDLSVTLEHVGFGGPVSLINRPGVPQTVNGFSADNFGNLTSGVQFVLDDLAANVYDAPSVAAPGTANITGPWKPDGGSLATFNGQSTLGTWRLRVLDSAALDTGAIRTLALLFDVNPIPGAGSLALLGMAGVLGGRRRRA